ncbi:baseplate J/gp47 family protein [Enterobacter kobei]|uniref:baseplate assembly protein n=1 Tax=Enterobacter kobei TaxID=208224 RepID=UPI0028D67F71|nr:baseplate J/gp47 family protein [Enterobacter kobei]WNP36392.1 baseplate J/gp47 family protein [Enterobacter kobei]
MNTIDLSQLPPPAVLEMPLFKEQKALRLAELQGLDSTFNALLESEPAMKLLEILVYREMVNIARFNSGVLATLLAYAKGDDLDQIGANFDVARQVVTPADDSTIPPTEAVMEDDESYRQRIRLSWYARNTAGAREAYEYYARGVGSVVLDAHAYGPPDTEPGYVDVYVLSAEGDGTPSADLLAAVNDALSPEDVRPLTDFVTVKAPEIIRYSVDATLVISTGPDTDAVVTAAKEGLASYTASVHKIETDVSIAGIYAALKQAGVDDVILRSPAATLAVGVGQAAWCESVTLSTQEPD